jgi:1-acyl-sn-glycerol-3-phosphate acyltransferase
MDRTAHDPFAAATAALTAVRPIQPIAPARDETPAASKPWRAGLSPLTAPLPDFKRPAARRLCRGLMLTLGQLVGVEHRERLAEVPDPAIFALNHRNRIEALLAPTVLLYLRGGASLHFLADWMFVEAPCLGWLLRQSEPVAVYGKPALFRWREGYRREQLRRAPLDTCADYLERGESVGIFPEGTRNRDGSRLLRGRLGLGELALRTAVPVVPIAIKYPAPDGADARRAPDGADSRQAPYDVDSRQAPYGADSWRAPYGDSWRAPWGDSWRAPYGALGVRMVLSIGKPLDCSAERRQLAAAPGPDVRRELARRVVNRVMAALAAELGKDYALASGTCRRFTLDVRPGGHHRGRRPVPAPLAAPAPHHRSEAT